MIERFFNKIKQCRRVATQYDKLAANYLAFVKLASIRIWLRTNESTTWLSTLRFSMIGVRQPASTQAPGKAFGQSVTFEGLNDKIDEDARL